MRESGTYPWMLPPTLGGGSRPRVLLVEDDESVRVSFERYLKGTGFEVVSVGDADRAFAILQWSSVDVVITDVRLGHQRSGLEVLEFVGLDRREGRDILTIVLTGVTLTEAEEAIIRRYPAYVFYKPHGYAEIVEFLRARLRAVGGVLPASALGAEPPSDDGRLL